MKTKLFSVSVICILSIIIAMPSFAFAATNAYSFTMNLRIVDWSKNGQYFKLNKGTAKLSGTHYQYSSDPSPVGPNPITYQLWNKTSGNSFGTIKATPNKNGTSSSVSGSYSGLGGGTKYYLQIFRVDDGRNIKGSGKISN